MVRQRIVMVFEGKSYWDGPRSLMLRGDPDFRKPEYWDASKSDKFGIALPQLLMEGWRITDVYPGGQNVWLVLLEHQD